MIFWTRSLKRRGSVTIYIKAGLTHLEGDDLLDVFVVLQVESVVALHYGCSISREAIFNIDFIIIINL